MAINWFRGGRKQQEAQEYSIDDLIVLERYDEAGERLRARLKDNPDDLHSHLKLAEVYTQLRQFEKAVDEYVFAAEEYAQDGFHDKGIALLAKAMKLAPLDPSLRSRAEKLQRGKSMEQVRDARPRRARAGRRHPGGTTALELKRLWHHLAGSTVVQQLPGESLKRLFAAMELLHLEPDDVIAREGSPEAFLLLIVQGVVEASVKAGGRAMAVRSFTSGDVVGEGALLERGAWPADYRTAEPVTALKLTREGLEKCLVGNPDPRGFLETLREQHNDRDVAATVAASAKRFLMAILPIRIYPDPVLRVKCKRVETFDDGLRKLAANMVDTMHAAPGVGLAAPQVGIDLRLAVVDISVGEDPAAIRVLVNPEILYRQGLETDTEGCLSLPGITDKVDRPLAITLRAQDLTGKPFELEAEEYLARAICHEVDHLDGILFTDHLRGLRKERVRRQLKKLASEQEVAV